MEGDVIKSFLVGLGFGVDDASLAKFNKAISSASFKVAALYGTIQAAAAGIFYSIAGISQGFENMGYELRLVAPAMNRWLVLRQAMLTAYSKAGINLSKVVQESIKFNYSLAKTKFAIEAAYKGVAAKFFPLLTKQMDIFRAKIFANMPKIQAQLMKFVEFIFKAFHATVELGIRLYSILMRVWDFFARLDKATHGWSTIILGVVAAWKLLNLAFLATPLGRIITGLLTLLTLFDDFKVWQEGGDSLFNWDKAVPSLKVIQAVLKGIVDTLEGVTEGIYDLLHGNWSGVADDLRKIENAFNRISKAVDNLVHSFNVPILDKLLAWRNKVDASVLGGLGALGSPGAGFIGPPAPLLPANSSSQQNINQQNSIVVHESADAHSSGKAVASQQDRVNFDMIRNLKGALQ